MKVLENSLTATDIVYCSHCRSKLEINSYDLHAEDVDMFDIAPVVKCPVCGAKSIYNGKKLNIRF